MVYVHKEEDTTGDFKVYDKTASVLKFPETFVDIGYNSETGRYDWFITSKCI